jgi:hypothetical protein
MGKFRDVVIALSFANLIFINRWLVAYDKSLLYFNYAPFSSQFYQTLLLSVGILALVMFLLAKLVRWIDKPIVFSLSKWIITSIIILEVITVRHVQQPRYYWLNFSSYKKVLGILPAYFIAALLLSFVVYICWRYRYYLDRVGITTIVILSPFIFITVPQAFIRSLAVDGSSPYPPRTPAPFVEQKPKRLVLFMIFDELGMHEAFDYRLPSIRLTAFDRLRSESLFATAAYSPNHETLKALPSLICGKSVEDAVPRDENELMLRFVDETEFVPWSKQQNIFTEARRLGVNSAFLGGLRHPYARVIGQSLNYTDYEENYDTKGMIQAVSTGSPYIDDLRTHLLGILDFFLTIPRQNIMLERIFPSHFAYVRNNIFSNLQKTELSLSKRLDEGRYSLIFVHWVVPHAPWIFRINNNSFVWETLGDGYPGNLMAADKILTDVRMMLEKKALWDQTQIIITSDHEYRAAVHGDKRVPLIIKLAGNSRGEVFQKKVNTVVLKKLALKMIVSDIDIKDVKTILTQQP